MQWRLPVTIAGLEYGPVHFQQMGRLVGVSQGGRCKSVIISAILDQQFADWHPSLRCQRSNLCRLFGLFGIDGSEEIPICVGQYLTDDIARLLPLSYGRPPIPGC